jgi:NADP-dependent 3-hydroxy acid dehydrogenase YdfG
LADAKGISRSGRLSGKVALVAGASSGIGEGAALALARAGASVVVSARRADRLDELVRRIADEGGQAFAAPADVTDEAAAERVVGAALERFGRVDILVNSAGIMRHGGVENADVAEWRRVLDVNLMAVLHTCKAVIGPMRAQGGGDIVNITSLSARHAAAAFGAYSASKHGLAALTEGLRQEVGAAGIRVCAIEPGATVSEVAEGISDVNIRAFIQDYVSKEGVMQPEDVGAAIVWICSLPPRANVSLLRIRPTMDDVAHPALLSNEGLMP